MQRSATFVAFDITNTVFSLRIHTYYRPQRSCGQGYVFTRVCDSVHGGGGSRSPPGREEAPQHGDPPWHGDPRQGDPPPSRETPLAKRPPPGMGRPPGKENPPAGRTHPPPRQGEPPGKETPQQGALLARRTPHPPPQQGETPPAGRPPPRHTVNEQPVRILLECILVSISI